MRRLAGVGAGLGVLAVVLLHGLRPDLPPVSSRLSEYAVGPWANVMTVAFVACGLALMAAAVDLARSAGVMPWRRTTVALLSLGGLGLWASAVFPTATQGTVSEALHSVSSGVATGAVAVAAAIRGLSLGPGQPGAGGRLVAVLGGLAAVTAAISPLLHRTAVTGGIQRVLWALLLAWLVATLRFVPRPGSEAGGATPPRAGAGFS